MIRLEKVKLESLINSVLDRVWSVDKDLNLISVNQAFVNLIHNITGGELKVGDSLFSILNGFSEPTIKKFIDFHKDALTGKAFSIIDENCSYRKGVFK